MNAVEIEEAVAALAEAPFDKDEFPFALLAAFDNKETTIKRLRQGVTNRSDIGGVLQTSYIHILACDRGEVSQGLAKLHGSAATEKSKARFLLVTDGVDLEAEDLKSGETIVCPFKEMPDKFGFFLPLAGIETIRQIRESAFDIKATGRLNKLYLELLKVNPEWGKEERREEMNHFLARLIFCFFAEDTEIFDKENMFTGTLQDMSVPDGSDVHERISEMFRAMNTRYGDRDAADIPRRTKGFPYVNGALFEEDIEIPRFNKSARTMLAHIGRLDWKKINPDIFGSMIQAVANEKERGSIGMHYTSVSNILKVLRPLFLDDLRKQLVEAGSSARKLLNLRKRLSRIRVFDPACGSGNFLVIAYKAMREIEYEINKNRGEESRLSEIPLTNFRGIEINSFPSEIARLALIIAEYQCNVQYRGSQAAVEELLPLSRENWIICGNALQIDWLDICPPTGKKVAYRSVNLIEEPHENMEMEFDNEGGETYICGNPPYLGTAWQSVEQKSDLKRVFAHKLSNWKTLDYVSAWFMKAAEYGQFERTAFAFVSTNSICQGQAVSTLWPAIFATGYEIAFAYTSFSWKNLARKSAGVTVVIVGLSKIRNVQRVLYWHKDGSDIDGHKVRSINAYLTAAPNTIVGKYREPLSDIPSMFRGVRPGDGNNLLLSADELKSLNISKDQRNKFVYRIFGSEEFIRGKVRYCLRVDDDQLDEAMAIPQIRERIELVRSYRQGSSNQHLFKAASTPHKFSVGRYQSGKENVIIVPRVSSINRYYLPVGLLGPGSIYTDRAFGMDASNLWCLALIASRLHQVWIATVCVRLKSDYSYSNTLGWNTFPVPFLTQGNKDRLTTCAEDILLARERHFPSTIAELYDPKKMPENLQRAHARNEEVVDSIYVGRRFRSDSDRLEQLLRMYTETVSSGGGANVPVG